MPLWKRNLFICWFGCFSTVIGMSLIFPFLPLYIQQLGVHNTHSIEKWSGYAFSATFLLSAIVAPIWGRLSELHGRKLMLIRASLGMAIIMTLMGLVQNVYELVGLRLLMGAVSGYISAAIILVASQTPKEHSGWALGTLSTGAVTGTLLGPLLGGWLSEVFGLRQLFFVTGAFLFMAFLITVLFLHEKFERTNVIKQTSREVWAQIKNPRLLYTLFLTTFMLQVANFSIEPFITIYVHQLMKQTSHIALYSGIVVSASALANVLCAPIVGKLSDRYGPRKILNISLIIAAIVFIPQAYVQNIWQLIALRFLMGMALSGLLPSVNSLVKQSVPQAITGRIFGFNQSAQFLGNLCGPNLGSQIAAHFSIHYVFFSTSILLILNALLVFRTRKMAPAVS